MNKNLTATLCAITSAIAMSPLYCQASDIAASATVSYADLNLAKSIDVRTLYGRLSRAADQVCPEDSIKAHEGCVREAMGQAVRRANLAALSALYTRITGLRVEPMLDGATLVAKSR